MKLKTIQIGHYAYKNENAPFTATSKAQATQELIGRGFKRADIRAEFKRIEAHLSAHNKKDIYTYIRSGFLSCEVGVTL